MRLLIASIAILVLAVGYFAYTEIQGRSKLNNTLEPVVAENPILPEVSHETIEPDNNYTATDARNDVIKEVGAEDEYEHLNQMSLEEEVFEELNPSEEECCPDEELAETDEPEKSMRERFMDLYLPQGFTVDEINRYTDLTEMQLRGESYTLEEHTEFWELLVRFQPNEENLKNYEEWKRLKERMVGGTWKSEWRSSQ